MKDNEKLVTLIRLRDIIYSGVRPTLGESGFSAGTIQELIKEQMIQSRDNHSDNDSDRYIIEAVLPAGHSFISQQHSLRDARN